MDRSYDVLVVGGGPTGSAAAHACAKAGLKTLMIEEQAHIGIPVQCAGLLSCSAFDECRVSTNSVLHTVSGATVIAGDASLSFDAKRTRAYVVDRSLLDCEMADDAADAGSEVQLKTIACRLSPSRHILTTRGVFGREDIRYRILIAADGPRALMGRLAGLKRAPVYLSGLQCDIPYDTDLEKVTLYPNASPEFFGWVIPLGAGRARAGLCGITNLKEKFDQFISGFGTGTVHYVSGTIPLGTLECTVAEGLMAVGDAAALAKPTSGGGIYTGVRSARHAAHTAVESCETERYDPVYLTRYEKRWKQDFGRDLRIGYLAFKARQYISPAVMEDIVAQMAGPEIADLIVEKGDMDRPGRFLTSLLLHPRTVRAAGPILASGIRNFERCRESI